MTLDPPAPGKHRRYDGSNRAGKRVAKEQRQDVAKNGQKRLRHFLRHLGYFPERTGRDAKKRVLASKINGFSVIYESQQTPLKTLKMEF
jgi:hypothetical protein